MRSLIIGNYIDDSIIRERGLPSSNPAGSNRMRNIAGAISLGNNITFILSSGSAARIKFSDKWIHPIKFVRKDDSIIIYSSALSIPYLSIIFEQISVALLFINLYRKYKFQIVFLYCYYPSTILAGIIAKLLRLKVVEDLQDIVTPKFSDVINNGALFALQQTIGYLLMHISLVISDVVLIPTKKFRNTFFVDKFLVIDGCYNSNNYKYISSQGDIINILYSGLINEENGRNLFLNTLSSLNNLPITNLVFHISGIIEHENEFKAQLQTFSNLNIRYYGFLDTSSFQNLLTSIDVSLVLQNPNGRNSLSKTPSKGFEYMYYGKVVICTNIGDFNEIPDDCIVHLGAYTSDNLTNKILELPFVNLGAIKSNAVLFATKNWDYQRVQRKIVDKLKLS
jgi:hypothetical protein